MLLELIATTRFREFVREASVVRAILEWVDLVVEREQLEREQAQ